MQIDFSKMLLRTAKRLMSEIENITYQRIPIRRLDIVAQPPTPADFLQLEVDEIADNNCLVECYRGLMKKYHPEFDASAEAQAKWKDITVAYDRIMLYRMAEQGLPEPYTPAYRGILPTSRAINKISKT